MGVLCRLRRQIQHDLGDYLRCLQLIARPIPAYLHLLEKRSGK